MWDVSMDSLCRVFETNASRAFVVSALENRYTNRR